MGRKSTDSALRHEAACRRVAKLSKSRVLRFKVKLKSKLPLTVESLVQQQFFVIVVYTSLGTVPLKEIFILFSSEVS